MIVGLIRIERDKDERVLSADRCLVSMSKTELPCDVKPATLARENKGRPVCCPN